MSDTPRLTIGIPTFNRPERLQRSIQSALGQSVPCRVIVADDGDTDEPERICREYADHPGFTYLKSPARKLWHNWRFVAERACDDGAEFFMWLQDDDLIAPRVARRIVRGFDQFPDANMYTSRLCMAYDNMLGCAWVGNWGPKLPLDLLWGGMTTFPGKLLVPIAYFDSWSMSPAKAFRVGDDFRAMLAALPDDCDMFTERLDIATMGLSGKAIADPNMAGYWMIHGRNESQLTTATCNDQVAAAFRYIDSLMDQVPAWRDELLSWMACLGTVDLIESLYNGIKDHRGKSPYCDQILNMWEDILGPMGKIRGVTDYETVVNTHLETIRKPDATEAEILASVLKVREYSPSSVGVIGADAAEGVAA